MNGYIELLTKADRLHDGQGPITAVAEDLDGPVGSEVRDAALNGGIHAHSPKTEGV